MHTVEPFGGGGGSSSSSRRLYTVPGQMKTEFSTVTATSGNDVVLGILINVLRLATICVVDVVVVVFSIPLRASYVRGTVGTVLY